MLVGSLEESHAAQETAIMGSSWTAPLAILKQAGALEQGKFFRRAKL